MRPFLWLFSLLFVGFSHPSWSLWLAPLGAVSGLALGWLSMQGLAGLRRFLASSSWFTLVQSIQISWLMDPNSHGTVVYAYFVYIVLARGLLFGCLTQMIGSGVTSLRRTFALAGCWTLIEWASVHIRYNVPFNPVGVMLTGNELSMQAASLFGIYGLTFVVILTNLLFLRMIAKREVTPWAYATLSPYVIGAAAFLLPVEEKGEIRLLAVETARNPVREVEGSFLSQASNDWEKILRQVATHRGKQVDLVLLPETFMPTSAQITLFPYEEARDLFLSLFGKSAADKLAPLQEPFASKKTYGKREVWSVSNLFWTQSISNLLGSDVVAGFRLKEKKGGASHEYNVLFHHTPGAASLEEIRQYRKQILVPFGELVPYQWMRDFGERYGLANSFTPGSAPVLFPIAGFQASLSICYEELFTYLMKEGADLGADLFINSSNDAWFPDSNLGQQHFDHARVRAIENGIPLVRAANAGVTGWVGTSGEVVQRLRDRSEPFAWKIQSLYQEVNVSKKRTPYQFWGDFAIVGLSIIALLMEAAALLSVGRQEQLSTDPTKFT